MKGATACDSSEASCSNSIGRLIRFLVLNGNIGNSQRSEGSLSVRSLKRTTAMQLGVALSLALMLGSAATGGARRLDARTLFLSGSVFLEGESPYDVTALSRGWEATYGGTRPSQKIFAYPPSILAVLGPIAATGALGFSLLDALSLLALGLLLWGVWRNAAGLGAEADRRWLAVLLASLTGGITSTLLLGQTGLWSIAPLAWMVRTDNDSLSLRWRVLCIAAAALKPTVALPFIAYWLVTDTAALFIAGALSLAVAVAVAAMTSGTAMPGEWLHSLQLYAAQGANLPERLVSLHHLLAKIWPQAPLKILPAVAAIGGLLVGLQARRRAFRPGRELILLSLVLCFMPLHSYDLALVAIMAGFAPLVGWRNLIWYGPALVLLMRSSAVARVAAAVLPGGGPDSHLLASLGALMMMIGVSAVFIFRGNLLDNVSNCKP
jgi:hypothetical protein